MHALCLLTKFCNGSISTSTDSSDVYHIIYFHSSYKQILASVIPQSMNGKIQYQYDLGQILHSSLVLLSLNLLKIASFCLQILTLSNRMIPTGITNFLISSASINIIKCLMIPFCIIKT